uniref:Uncharacterized protein n=1 Tax=Ananas comosus var. bracteatus TaxID=296719 RepID=A0A6V7NXY2_ANACO|nr:unnamed protein product [Ananas comosus var. bracteatus]
MLYRYKPRFVPVQLTENLLFRRSSRYTLLSSSHKARLASTSRQRDPDLSRHSPELHRDSYSPCGIGRRSGLPWARLIPRVGMMTTTGPLGSASARQPTVVDHFPCSFGPCGAFTETYGGSGHVPGGLPLGPGA